MTVCGKTRLVFDMPSVKCTFDISKPHSTCELSQCQKAAEGWKRRWSFLQHSVHLFSFIMDHISLSASTLSTQVSLNDQFAFPSYLR